MTEGISRRAEPPLAIHPIPTPSTSAASNSRHRQLLQRPQLLLRKSKHSLRNLLSLLGRHMTMHADYITCHVICHMTTKVVKEEEEEEEGDSNSYVTQLTVKSKKIRH